MIFRSRVPALLASLLCLAAASPPPPRSEAESAIVLLMHRAAEERRKGDYAAAAKTYRQVLGRAPQLYEAHLFLGDTLRKRRLNDEAETEFQAARQIRPADPLPYASLAELRCERFRFPEALALLDEGEAVVPRNRREPLAVARGTALLQAGNGGLAVEVLRQAVKEFPNSPRVAEALARTLEAQGLLPEALEAWSQAARLAPENDSVALEMKDAREFASRLDQAEAAARAPGAGPEAWGTLARLRFLAREYPPAAAAAAAALGFDPARADLLFLRGLALEREGKGDEAEDSFRKVGERSSEHLLALYHRAYLARLRGDRGSEEKIWREAVEKHPRDAAARLMLILAWKRKDVLDARIASLQKDAKRGKGTETSRILEGMALEEAGREAEAAEVYEGLFIEEPRDPEAAARLSALLSLRPQLLSGRLEEASFRHSREGKGSDPGRHLLLAQILQVAGRGKAALEELGEAAALFPDREEVHLALASALGTLGGDPAAISRELDRALRLAPASPWAHLEKGLALLQAGDYAGAVKEGGRAISLAPDLAEGWELTGAAKRLARDYAGAVTDLRVSLLMDPADSPGVVRFQLVLALATLGDRQGAREAMEGETPPFPDLLYRLSWSFVRRSFLDRSFRGQDWLSWRDRFSDPMASPAQACAAVAEMLASLRDPYTRLRGQEETSALYARPRSGKLETDALGTPTSSSASVLTGELGGNLGYIRLTNLSDPSARESIRRALDRMAQKDGLVLDLRGNPGGQVADAEAIEGLLLQPGEETGRERTRYGERVQTSTQTRPSYPRRPLVILTDRRTGSAAEKLAAGLQGAGRATVLGEETFGKGASQLGRLLPGGTMVLVTAAENLTREGRPIQGRGVIPDVSDTGDTSLEKAKEILKQPTPEEK